MFDNLREDATTSYDQGKFQPTASTGSAFGASPRSKRILGMTSFQLFVITFLLMLAVCVVGAMALFATNKIGF